MRSISWTVLQPSIKNNIAVSKRQCTLAAKESLRISLSSQEFFEGLLRGSGKEGLLLQSGEERSGTAQQWLIDGVVVAQDVVVKRRTGLRQTDCVGTLKCFVLDVGLFDYSLETQHEHIYYLTFIHELSSDLTERITQRSRADNLKLFAIPEITTPHISNTIQTGARHCYTKHYTRHKTLHFTHYTLHTTH